MHIKSSASQKKLDTFLDTHYTSGKALILALSGGPDSLALLALVLNFKARHPFPLHIAHVDHSWRPESREEAIKLKEYIESLSLPFHLHTLESDFSSSNLEASCREARLHFFKQLAKEVDAEAVLLAHHQADQAETTLKHLLESKAFSTGLGIAGQSTVDSLRLWRPLLSCKKEELLTVAKQLDILPVHDKTNHDPRFLRGRFRKEIFPFLNSTFGRDITSSLTALSKESRELDAYFKEKLAAHLRSVCEGPFGKYLQIHPEMHPLELKQLLRMLKKQEDLQLSRGSIDVLIEQLLSGAANKWIEKHCFVDRYHIFILKNEIPSCKTEKKLELGKTEYESWNVTLSLADSPLQSSWKDAWKGKACVLVPKGVYRLAPTSSLKTLGLYRSFSKQLSKRKVPACLWDAYPVLLSKEGDVFDLFSSKTTNGIKVEVNTIALVDQS